MVNFRLLLGRHRYISERENEKKKRSDGAGLMGTLLRLQGCGFRTVGTRNLIKSLEIAMPFRLTFNSAVWFITYIYIIIFPQMLTG